VYTLFSFARRVGRPAPRRAAGALLAVLVAVGPALARAQAPPPATQEPAGDHAAPSAVPGHAAPAQPTDHGAAPAHAAPAGAHGEPAQGEAAHGGGEHGESLFSFVSRILNFLILAGGLWYLLRLPFGRYLGARAEEIKGGLTSAAALRAQASARLSDIETRVRALPAEIDALKKRGSEEIVAEEARIRQVVDAERQRLVDNARREIDLQLQSARRDLTHHAADLAVDLAEQRIRTQITGEDQRRLIDRYVTQMRAINE
jgi:F-type H+-transporting ATPase subunit b